MRTVSVSEMFMRWGLRHWMALAAVAYALVTTLAAQPRLEPWLFALLALTLVVLGRRCADLSDRIVPYVLFLVAYDVLRYARDIGLRPERVSVCGARALEVALFGLGSNSTPGERLAPLQSPALDLLFAAPYFVFAYVVVVYALFLFSWDRQRMSRYLWSFALANVAAFSLWLVLPVAPPWYQHAYGCRVDLGASASPAGLLRVDAFLHIHYFAKLYGKSAYLFGAWPSLHCTYPMIGLLTAWQHTGWRTRPLHIVYVGWMFCASVYLDHHYIIDGLSGFALAAASVFCVSRIAAHQRPAVAPL